MQESREGPSRRHAADEGAAELKKARLAAQRQQASLVHEQQREETEAREAEEAGMFEESTEKQREEDHQQVNKVSVFLHLCATCTAL